LPSDEWAVGVGGILNFHRSRVANACGLNDLLKRSGLAAKKILGDKVARRHLIAERTAASRSSRTAPDNRNALLIRSTSPRVKRFRRRDGLGVGDRVGHDTRREGRVGFALAQKIIVVGEEWANGCSVGIANVAMDDVRAGTIAVVAGRDDTVFTHVDHRPVFRWASFQEACIGIDFKSFLARNR